MWYLKKKKKSFQGRKKISRKIFPETEPSSIRRRKLVKGETHGVHVEEGVEGGGECDVQGRL